MKRDVEKWRAAARTPQTRARIRRWALLRSVFFTVMIACACGFVVTIVTSTVLAFFGEDAPWWGPVVALGVLLAAVLLWCLAWTLLDAARYADGDEAVGTIIEVSADDSMGPDSNPAYDMLIVAGVAADVRIRRVAREFPRDEPQPGQSVRFIHNSQDPDDLNDILFLGFIDEVGPRSEEA